ncbi:unnamed protein product [Ectocarpus fasciculatus]
MAPPPPAGAEPPSSSDGGNGDVDANHPDGVPSSSPLEVPAATPAAAATPATAAATVENGSCSSGDVKGSDRCQPSPQQETAAAPVDQGEAVAAAATAVSAGGSPANGGGAVGAAREESLMAAPGTMQVQGQAEEEVGVRNRRKRRASDEATASDEG